MNPLKESSMSASPSTDGAVLPATGRTIDADRRPASRWKAAGTHLAISVGIAALVLITMLVVWYPPPLFQAAGGDFLLFVLVSIDVVIGPLVTLIIFNAATKTRRAIRFDLAVIGLLQLGALAYGCHAVFLARPVYLVYTNDRIDVVTVKDISAEDLAVAPAQYRKLPWGRPRLVAARQPTDARARESIMFSAVLGGKDIQFFPQYYAPFEQAQKDVLANAKPLSTLIRRHPESREKLERVVDSLGRKMKDVSFLPVRAKTQDFSALIDASTGAMLGNILVDPWD
jgi:hypothetical protein